MNKQKDDYDYYSSTQEETSEWDARQIFIKRLEELDIMANDIKTILEMRIGGLKIILRSLIAYFSILRQMYRKIRYLFKDAEEWDKKIIDLRERIKRSGKGIKGTNVLIFPLKLEDDLEKFHNEISTMLWKKGLKVPLRKTETDPAKAPFEGLFDEE